MNFSPERLPNRITNVEIKNKKMNKEILVETVDGSSTKDDSTHVSPACIKPNVSGSLLLYELMQVAAIKNEDGMPVVSYVDKPNGGSVAYLRHDAVVKKLNSMMDTSFPSADDAGVVAVKISESVEPQLTAQEQAYFIAGFIECVKWLSGHCNDR